MYCGNRVTSALCCTDEGSCTQATPWEKHHNDEGIPYWWNRDTEESVWDDPTA
jgi:hypothetical protein